MPPVVARRPGKRPALAVQCCGCGHPLCLQKASEPSKNIRADRRMQPEARSLRQQRKRRPLGHAAGHHPAEADGGRVAICSALAFFATCIPRSAPWYRQTKSRRSFGPATARRWPPVSTVGGKATRLRVSLPHPLSVQIEGWTLKPVRSLCANPSRLGRIGRSMEQRTRRHRHHGQDGGADQRRVGFAPDA
jgi:hypothetical protein